jgi:hypothetical protein
MIRASGACGMTRSRIKLSLQEEKVFGHEAIDPCLSRVSLLL